MDQNLQFRHKCLPFQLSVYDWPIIFDELHQANWRYPVATVIKKNEKTHDIFLQRKSTEKLREKFVPRRSLGIVEVSLVS